MQTELIAFSGQTVQGFDSEGTPYAVLRPMCESLGVNYAGQEQKLKAAKWATICSIHTVAADGKRREMTCISADTIPIWLATIQSGRVKPECRAALEVFQCEARDALYQHFCEDRALTVNGRPLVDLSPHAEDRVRQIFREETARNRATGMPPRMNFRTRDQEEMLCCVDEYYDGCCPTGCKTPLLSVEGERLDGMIQFDHFYGRQNNDITSGWPVCPKCHIWAENNRDKARHKFDEFQQTLKARRNRRDPRLIEPDGQRLLIER